jgi:hypothetical protein
MEFFVFYLMFKPGRRKPGKGCFFERMGFLRDFKENRSIWEIKESPFYFYFGITGVY